MNNPAVAARQSELNKLKEYLINTVSRELESAPPTGDDRRKVINQNLMTAYQNTRLQLPTTIRDQLFREILDDLLGFGPLQPLIEDQEISEIMVNGPNNVYIERRGKLTKTNVTFENDDAVVRVIEKIVLPLGRHIDADSPTVDARLPDGSRVNAVLPPVAIDGPIITIRKFQKDKRTAADQLGIYHAEHGRFRTSMCYLTVKCPYFGRHRFWQDNLTQHSFRLHT
jgi:pilus assembly protein CpaF